MASQMASTSIDPFQVNLITGTDSFAQIMAKNLQGILGTPFTQGSSGCESDGIRSNKNVFVSIMFTGSVFGEFILALSEETGAKLLGKNLSADESLRQELADTFSEILNITVGESIVRLSSVYKHLTITAPRVHFGQIKYPRVKNGHATIESEAGPLDCILYIDRMQLDLAASYKKALASLLVAHKKLRSAMTELKDRQNQMLQSEKMAALGTMAGGLAHEINTPLATICLIENQLRELLESEECKKNEVIELLDEIEMTTKRIATITQSLRTYARGLETAEAAVKDATDLIRQSAQPLLERIKTIGIDLQMKGINTLNSKEWNFEGLTQVVHALISNSVDAVESLTDRWIHIETEENNDFFELRVTDSGLGLPREIFECAFDPFFSTKDPGHGAGLGLSIAKGIVIAHGGTLYCNPKSPHTQFVLRIPRATKATLLRTG